MRCFASRTYNFSSPPHRVFSYILILCRYRSGSYSIFLLGFNNLPITSLPFTPFPVPTDTPIVGTHPQVRPQNPPPTSDSGRVIPDFGEAWKVAYDKAKSKISSWSLEDKVATTTGTGWQTGLCVGVTPKVQDFPGLCLQVGILSLFQFFFLTVSFRTAPWVFAKQTL